MKPQCHYNREHKMGQLYKSHIQGKNSWDGGQRVLTGTEEEQEMSSSSLSLHSCGYSDHT